MKKTHLVVLLALSAASANSQSAHHSLRRGDTAYDKKHYAEAETAYRKALAQQPADARALYNAGNAVYRQGNYAEAGALFAETAKNSTDPSLKAEALHNLGNAHLKQNQWAKAVEAYENSLRLRPGAPGTKGNLQFAKKKLQEQQEKPKPKADEQQQNPNQPQPEQPQEPKQSENQQQPGEQPQPEQQPQQPAEAQRLDAEEARRRLERNIGPADQKSARRYRENQRDPAQPRAKKDW